LTWPDLLPNRRICRRGYLDASQRGISTSRQLGPISESSPPLPHLCPQPSAAVRGGESALVFSSCCSIFGPAIVSARRSCQDPRGQPSPVPPSASLTCLAELCGCDRQRGSEVQVGPGPLFLQRRCSRDLREVWHLWLCGRSVAPRTPW
jgi:hypothetical protein